MAITLSPRLAAYRADPGGGTAVEISGGLTAGGMEVPDVRTSFAFELVWAAAGKGLAKPERQIVSTATASTTSARNTE